MEFKTKQELYEFLNKFNFDSVRETPISSVYFLVKYEEYIEPVYFTPFQGIWLPSPCSLNWFPCNDDELDTFVKSLYHEGDWAEATEYERIMQKNNVHYQINCWQCKPFLPEEVEILEVFGESQCLDWLLKNKKDVTLQ